MFVITKTELYILVVILSTQDNAQLLQQLKLGFKRTINLNKFYTKPEIKEQNPWLDHFIDPNFQEISSLCFTMWR